MAVDRKTPTTLNFGPTIGGSAYADAVNEEVAALWDRTPVYLSSLGGTGNAITALAIPTEIAYLKGKSYYMQPTANNTGAATININSLGLRDIKLSDGSALTGGEMLIGNTLHLLDTGTQLRIQSGAADSTAASQVPISIYGLQSSGDGGSVTGGSRQKYPLNYASLNEIGGASLNGVTNQITLPAGTYEFEAGCLMRDCGRGYLMLRNLSVGADISTVSRVAFNEDIHQARIIGKFSLVSTSTLELHYFATANRATYGLGANAGSVGALGLNEQFGFIQFRKVL